MKTSSRSLAVRLKLGAVMGAATLGLGTFVLGPAPTASAASLPSCVQQDISAVRLHYAGSKNNCSYGIHVKAVVTWGPDSSCHYLKAHSGWWYYWPSLGFPDHGVRC